MMASSRNRRIIDLSAIRENMTRIRQLVPAGVSVMAVVKADGYGHGAVEAAQAAVLGGADMLAVASVSEGEQLRAAGIITPVLVLGETLDSDVGKGVRNHLIQTVCSPHTVSLCEKAASSLNLTAEVHLKIDTGMGRIGVRTEAERDSTLSALASSPHVLLTGAYTHFSDADGDQDGIDYTRVQFQRFLRMTETLPDHVLRHCCNSAAIHRFPEMALDMVRAGISLYGYPPVPSTVPLTPCMTWVAEISHIKELPAGSFVSYGRTYQSPGPIRVATITCGYGDGYHRAAGNKAAVLIRGKRAGVIGRICMDQMMADVTEIPEAHVGDPVILMGKDADEEITAEHIARWAGTISYEVLLSAGRRVDRVFISTDEGKEYGV